MYSGKVTLLWLLKMVRLYRPKLTLTRSMGSAPSGYFLPAPMGVTPVA